MIVRLWGRYTSTLMYVLTYFDRGLPASRLAAITGIPSRLIYSFLKYWIEKGVVRIRRIYAKLYVYVLDRKWRNAVKEALDHAERKRKIQVEIALRHIEERLGRKLEPAEEQLLIILLHRALGEGSSYIRIPALSPLEATQHLKDMVYNRLKGRVKNPELEAEKTPRQLQELIAHGVIYASYVRRGATGGPELIIRLDQAIEHELRQVLKHLQG